MYNTAASREREGRRQREKTETARKKREKTERGRTIEKGRIEKRENKPSRRRDGKMGVNKTECTEKILINVKKKDG